MKISRNPAVAYQQGIAEGREQRRSNDTICGFELLELLLRTAMYNANYELKVLSTPKLADFWGETLDQLIKYKEEVIAPDGGISNSDKMDLILYHDRRIEKEFEEAQKKREERVIKCSKAVF